MSDNNESIYGLYDNHSRFNKFQTMYGMRPSEIGTKPSIYITTIKLRKALNELNDIEIENIYEKEMTGYNIGIHRKKLKDKVENLLHEWQILTALNILLEQGRYESILYIQKCKRTDKQPN